MAWSISDLFPPWGDAGERPSDNFQYDGGDQVNEKHIDYNRSSLYTLEDEVRSALTDIDSDKDGIVDEADTANLYKGNDIDSNGDGKVDNADQADNADTVDGQNADDLAPTIDDGTNNVQVVSELRFGAEGTSTTSTSYTTISASDMARDFSNMQNNSGNVYVRMVAHLYHNGTGTTYLRMYRQNAATAVTGTEVSKSGDGWGTVTTGWVDLSAESGFESYQLQMRTDDGAEGRYNSVFLQIGTPV